MNGYTEELILIIAVVHIVIPASALTKKWILPSEKVIKDLDHYGTGNKSFQKHAGIQDGPGDNRRLPQLLRTFKGENK